MKLSPFYILLLIAHACYSETDQNTTAVDPEFISQIDEFITEHYLPNAGITGLGISIVRINGSDQAVYSKGYGMADQEKGISNGKQTQFLLGSITKSFTSALVAKILNEKFPEMGEAVLDTPIRKLIPSANFTLIDRFRSEYGTFRDLLAHRMCFDSNDLQSTAEGFTNVSELVFRQRYAEEICGIRSDFQYYNGMFVMAGELIGILANKSYETLAEDLLTEIGMFNSTLSKKSDDYDDLPYRARPYYNMDTISHPMNTDLLKRIIIDNAAGGLWSTPDDMAKYMSFHLNLGKVGDNQVIPESVMKSLSAPSNLITDNNFKSTEEDIIVNPISYGLGLFRASFDGWEYVFHGGSFPPFSSILSLFPSQKIGIFTTSNQSPVLIDQQVLHTNIFDILRGSPNALEISSKIIERERVKLAQHKIKRDKTIEKFLGQVGVGTCQKGMSSLPRITGHYGSGSLGDLKILEKFNPEINSTGLYLLYGKWAHGWLESYEGRNNDTEVVNLTIIWDTDLVQDNYAAGDSVGHNYARVNNQTFEFFELDEGEMVSIGKFRLGVSLENLPIIPWKKGSCGREIKVIYKI